MDLPTLILSLFEGVKVGVLDPIVTGLYYISPWLFYGALIGAVIALIFAQRKAQWVLSCVLIAAVAYLLPHVPELLNGAMTFELPVPSVELGGSSAFDAADSAVEAGSHEALDTLADISEAEQG